MELYYSSMELGKQPLADFLQNRYFKKFIYVHRKTSMLEALGRKLY